MSRYKSLVLIANVWCMHLFCANNMMRPIEVKLGSTGERWPMMLPVSASFGDFQEAVRLEWGPSGSRQRIWWVKRESSLGGLVGRTIRMPVRDQAGWQLIKEENPVDPDQELCVDVDLSSAVDDRRIEIHNTILGGIVVSKE